MDELQKEDDTTPYIVSPEHKIADMLNAIARKGGISRLNEADNVVLRIEPLVLKNENVTGATLSQALREVLPEASKRIVQSGKKVFCPLADIQTIIPNFKDPSNKEMDFDVGSDVGVSEPAIDRLRLMLNKKDDPVSKAKEDIPLILNERNEMQITNDSSIITETNAGILRIVPSAEFEDTPKSIKDLMVLIDPSMENKVTTDNDALYISRESLAALKLDELDPIPEKFPPAPEPSAQVESNERRGAEKKKRELE